MNAKNLILGIIFFIPVLFASCELEQTSLNVDSIKGQATIKGRVLYKSGEIQSGNYVNEIWKAAKGQTIFAYINNSDLTGNAMAEGQSVYSAELDSLGNYELVLPATTTGFNVKLSLSNFEGNYSLYDGLNATSGAIQYTQKAGFYTSATVNQSIKDNFKYVVDFDNYDFTTRSVLEHLETPDFVKVSGKVNYLAEVRNIDSTTVIMVGKAAIGKKLIITSGNTYYSAVSKSIIIGDTEMSIYEFYLPVENGVENKTINITPVTFESNYTHYVKNGLKYNTSTTLKGKYSSSNVMLNIELNKGLSSFIIPTINYSFTEYPDYAQ